MSRLTERLERLRALRARDLSSVLAVPSPGDSQISEVGEGGLSSVLAVPPPTCGQILGSFSFGPRVDSLALIPLPGIRAPSVGGVRNLDSFRGVTAKTVKRSSFLGRPFAPKNLPTPTDGDCQNCQKPPVWHDLDRWRDRWREAATVALRREVIAAWAEAAGGEVRDGTLRLPSGLPRRLARAEMTANASYIGLTVAEVSPPRCAGCPNSPIPGDSLCDHCQWLAGPATVPETAR